MKSKYTPEIRFPRYKGNWKKHKIGEFLTESRVSGTNGLEAKKLTIKLWGKGVVPKDDTYQGSEATKYYIRRAGQFIYGKLDFIHQAFGIIPDKLDGYESTLDAPAFDISDNLNPYFFLEYVSRKQFYLYQGMIADGSRKAKRIHSDTFLEMPLMVPTIEEQTDIGNFFKKLDDTIVLQQGELTTLKQTKQGFLQTMFPKEGELVPEIRFPEFTGDWEHRKLNKVFKDFIVPMRDKPKEFSGTIPWTRIEDIEGRFINGTTSGKYVSEETIKSMNLKIIPKGSLIVSASATFGVVAIVNNDLITNQTFIGLVPNTNYNIDYLYVLFQSPDIQKKMKKESAGSTIFYIPRKRFEDMIGKFPELEEQKKIGNFFKQLDDIIDLHQRELNALKETKKALVQKMFV